jgi:hypothetical protein
MTSCANLIESIRPLLRDRGFEVPVEGGIDLARIEVARQVGQLWSRAADHSLGDLTDDESSFRKNSTN